MRWKFSREGGNMYICCGCVHVRTGTVFLAISTLLAEAAFLVFMSCLMVRPDMMPPWMTCFLQTPSGEMKLRTRRQIGPGMMDDNIMLGPNVMGDGIGGMMGSGQIGASDGRGSMMGGAEDVEVKVPSTPAPTVKPTSVFAHDVPMMSEIVDTKDNKQPPVGDWAAMPHMKDLPQDLLDEMVRRMQDAGIPVNVADMPHSIDEIEDAGMPQNFDDTSEHVAIPGRDRDWKPMPMFDKSSGAWGKDRSKMMDNFGVNDNDDDRPLIGESGDELMPFNPRMKMWDSDDKLFAFVMVMCCITSSVLLIYGVIKGYPGYMMPFMGLQVFSFCATGLIVFSCFSYVPNIKHWISQLPETLPWKASLMEVNTDRLMLSVVLIAVSVLVVKAYLMGMVWTCYKYVSGMSTQSARRRSTEADGARNPEDSEMLLPPKYEDIMTSQPGDSVAVTTEADGPPPYVAQ